MPTQRPFRFAADFQATTRTAFLERVQQIEKLGYNTVLTGDHPTGDMLGQVATLTAVALTSQSLSVASQVFANDFRNPVLLSRELATIDILAEGRFEFGIGTGWAKDEYLQIGVAYDPPVERVDRFVEALQIFKHFFSGEPFSYTGKYYTIQNHTGLKSFQRPHPRMFIGGGGKRMLALAAREADIVGINTGMTTNGEIDFATMTAQAVREKVEWVKQTAGARLSAIELQILVLVVTITDDRRQAAAQLLRDIENAPIANRDAMGIEDILESPYFLIGTVEQMAEQLLQRREQLGISYISVFGDEFELFGQVIARLAGR